MQQKMMLGLEHACSLLYCITLQFCIAGVTMCNFHDPHTDTHAHRPAAFSEGPRPADSLISSSLQTEQKGMEIFHLLAESVVEPL